jgi:hypothetical protein
VFWGKISRTSRPISIKLRTEHPWLKEILNCSNKGPDPLQRGGNHKMQRWDGVIRKSFSRTIEPEELRFT